MTKLNLRDNPPAPIYTFCRVVDCGTATIGDAVRYAREVVEGERMAGKWIKLACARFLRDLARCEDPDDDLEFSIERAEHVLEFFQTYLVHVKASVKTKAGDPVALMDWHIFILVNLFGFIKPLYDDETGERIQDNIEIEEGVYEMRDVYIRRFSNALILVGRKNAKSFLATGIGLYMMCFDDEGGAEVYSAATKRDQARIVFDDAKQMVEKSPALREIIKTAKLSIYHVDSYSKFVPLASEADSLDGLNVHLGILDEVHAMKSRDLYDVIETATGSRRQPLILSISTAGVILNGICAELRDYGQTVLQLDSGSVGDAFFFLYYTIDKCPEGEQGDHDDDFDETKWYKANPGLGASKALKTMREQAEKAQQAVDARANFMTKHLNIFVSGASAWMDMIRWAELKNANPKNIPYWVGVDLANKIDMAAAVKVYYVLDGPAEGHMVIRPKFWLPEGRLKTCSKSQRELYRSFSNKGLLKLTDGDVIDHKEIEQDLLAWIEEDKENFQELAYDPWQATQFALAMAGHGLEICEVTQTVKNLNEAMVKIQETVFSGKFHHPHNLCYDWMMGNVQVKPDKNNNIFPDKSSLENKIDGPAATFNAISRIIRHITDAIIPVADPEDWGTM